MSPILGMLDRESKTFAILIPLGTFLFEDKTPLPQFKFNQFWNSVITVTVYHLLLLETYYFQRYTPALPLKTIIRL